MCHGIMDTCTELGGPLLASCVWAMGRLGSVPPGTLPAILEEMLADRQSKAIACSFQQLADVVWSVARLQAGFLHCAQGCVCDMPFDHCRSWVTT